MCNNCQCSHVPDLGACPTFEEGSNGRCVYCDHADYCHSGSNDRFNTPLGQELTSMLAPSVSELFESAPQQCKIVASWDPESGCSVGFMRQSLRGRAGYVNFAQVNGSVYLVWSADWIHQTLAEMVVKRAIRP